MEKIYDLLSWPFAWVLTVLYFIFQNYGLTIIVFTILVRIFMLPIGIKQQKTSLMQVKFQPKIKELQEKYKNNKVKMNEEMQKLYQEEGYNPLGGCLPMLIQLPIILVLYNIITRPLTNICKMDKGAIEMITNTLKGIVDKTADLKSQISIANLMLEYKGSDKLISTFEAINNRVTSDGVKVEPINFDFITKFNFHFFGLDLSQKPTLALNALILIPLFAAATGFLVGYISQKYSAVQATGTMKSLMYISPLLSLFYAFIFPAGVGLYWIMSNITSALQSLYLGRKYNPREYAEKLKAEEEERKRQEKQRLKEKRAAKFGTALPDKTGSSDNIQSKDAEKTEEEEQQDD